MEQPSDEHTQQQPEQNQQESLTQVLPETLWIDDPMPSGIPPEGSAVITISRQLGSGGAEIGRLIAEKSGLHYVDREIINTVAQRLGVEIAQAESQDEQTGGPIAHLLEAIHASNPFAVDYRALFGPEKVPAQSRESIYLHLTQKVILETATHGNAVIIGRGSQFLLHNAPRTLHVYIFAPLPYRIEIVMKRMQIDHAQAEQLIKQRDYENDMYLRKYYGSDGHQPGFYHLLINTGLFSLEQAADLIYRALPLVQNITG